MATKAKKFTINVYDNDKKIIKTSTAVDCEIRFGSIRKIMALIDMDDIDNTAALLKTIYGAWDQTTKVLSECFPDMTEEDWDNVYISELVPVIVGIAKSSVEKIFEVPSEKN